SSSDIYTLSLHDALPILPLVGWYLRWIPWIVSGFACVGYLSGVLTTQPLTLVSLLLLTGTYGAWLVIYHIGLRQFMVRPNPWWRSEEHTSELQSLAYLVC